jgi:hypothetical protein
MCKDANAAKAMLFALRTALDGHPAGPLTPGFWHIHKPGEPLDFLGYTITPRSNGTLKFDLGPRSRNKIERKICWVKNELRKEGLGKNDKAGILISSALYAKGLRQAFPLWRGGDYILQKFFNILEDMAFKHGLEIELPPIKQKKKEFF